MHEFTLYTPRKKLSIDKQNYNLSEHFTNRHKSQRELKATNFQLSTMYRVLKPRCASRCPVNQNRQKNRQLKTSSLIKLFVYRSPGLVESHRFDRLRFHSLRVTSIDNKEVACLSASTGRLIHRGPDNAVKFANHLGPLKPHFARMHIRRTDEYSLDDWLFSRRESRGNGALNDPRVGASGNKMRKTNTRVPSFVSGSTF